MVRSHAVKPLARRVASVLPGVFVLLGGVFAGPIPARADVPACTTIPVELIDKLDSAQARLGDRFRFRAIDSVLTRDRVKINAQTVGYGLVTYVQAAGAHARPGELLIEARYFALANGRQYQVTVDASSAHSGSNGNAPGIVGAVPVPLIGAAVGAFNYFHAGKNVTIPTGYQFAVTPVGDLSKKPNCLRVPTG
jgi:hypothetical protein